MWLSCSSVGRKFVMAVTGAVLVLFVTFHCCMNSIAICWPAAYNSLCEFLGANWYALIASVFLAGFIVLHIIYAMILTFQNRKARGNVAYAVSKKPKTVEWSSKNMLVLGIVILAFLVIHLIQFWAKMQLQEIRGVHDVLPPAAGTLFLQEAFATDWTWIVYIIGFIALWFHLNHGIWSMFQSTGWDNTPWIARLKKVACWWSSLVVLLFIAETIVFTAKAHDNYFKTDPVLRAQYQEMIAPMFEKDFGPDAARTVAGAPYEQVKQIVNNSVQQMESPQAQAYMANDPNFASQLETMKAAKALFDYLDEGMETEIMPLQGIPGPQGPQPAPQAAPQAAPQPSDQPNN